MMLSFKQLHDEVTRLVDAIRNGGGGGGSTVTVTQKRTTGDNIAAITVNGNVTELYAPNDAKDIAFDNDKEGVFSNDNVQDVLDEVGYTLTDHDTRITQNTSDISDLNDTLKQDKEWKFVGSYTARSGISLPSDIEWNEAIVECVFGFNISVAFTFNVAKWQAVNGRNPHIYLNGAYNSADDYHSILLSCDAGTHGNGGFAVITWNWGGQNALLSDSTIMNIYVR